MSIFPAEILCRQTYVWTHLIFTLCMYYKLSITIILKTMSNINAITYL